MRRTQRGFTLLEVLVAITITAVLGVGAFLLLSQALRNKDAVETRAIELAQLQKADRVLAGDLTQIVDRPVRNAYGDELPALMAGSDGNLVELTRTGWRDGAALLQELELEDTLVRRSQLQRVAYRLEDERLLRDFWTVLDRSPDSEPQTQALLDQVTRLELRYLASNNQWSEDWPPSNLAPVGGDEAKPLARLPKAIEVRYEHARFGDIRRLFPVAGAVVLPAGSGAAGGAATDQGNGGGARDEGGGSGEPAQGATP